MNPKTDPGYIRWSSRLKEEFGSRVHKISLDLGTSCPHRKNLREGGCIFCDFRGGGSGALLQGISLEEQIRQGAQRALGRFKARKAILYFQSYSASNIPSEQLGELMDRALEEAARYIPVVGIALGTRPDLVEEDFLKLLGNFMKKGLKIWLELGVQTTNSQGLIFLRRGHSLEAVARALEKAAGYPELRLCAHLIAGIPGEPRNQLCHSLAWLTSRDVSDFKFHPLHVLQNTPLEELYRQGSFEPLELKEYAYRVAEALKAFPHITVQRLTADAHPPFLVAPRWIKHKSQVVQAIENLL